MKNKCFAALVLLIVIDAGPLFSDEEISIHDSMKSQNISSLLRYHEDINGYATVFDVQKLKAEWAPVGKNQVNLGFTDSAYWFRFTLTNRTDKEQNFYIEITHPTIDFLDLYIKEKDPGFQVKTTGDMLPFSSRDVPDRNFIFKVDLKPGKQLFYLRAATSGSLYFSAYIYNSEGYIERSNRDNPVLWMYYGSLLLLIFYQLFIFISLRERSYLYLILFIASWALYDFVIKGIALQYLWPASTSWNNSSLMFFIISTVFWFIMFMGRFLETGRLYPAVDRLIRYGILIPGAVLMVLTRLLPFQVLIRLVHAYIVISSVFLMVFIFTVTMKKNRVAYFFLAGVVMLIFSTIIEILHIYDYLEHDFITQWNLEISMTFLMVFSSFGLVDRISRIKKSLEASEKRYRDFAEMLPQIVFEMELDGTLKYVNRSAFGITGYSKDDLEKGLNALSFISPADRKRLLKNISLIIQGENSRGNEYTLLKKDGSAIPVLIYSTAIIRDGTPAGLRGVIIDISDRKKAVDLMIHTEKMVTIGGLAAGMAHEINNPLSIILQGIQMSFLRLSPENERNRKYAHQCGVDLDKFNFYMEERGVKQYLKDIHAAGIRAAEIVNNMLNFSRKESPRKQNVDLNSLIDETIELAAKSYDYSKKFDFRQINIVRNYDMSLPEIQVIKTEIGQVILNIIKNAAFAACEKQEENHSPEIAITTKMGEKSIVIEIADNGPGMDPGIIKHIFDPFFTTKSSGSGTGLGLSISYYIVTNNHEGTIEVDSEQGRGARFIIKLPINS